MSNSLAIAAVTATLQSILQQSVTLDPDLSDTTVTILPLDKARANNNNNQLNLFLYMIVRNAAWVNADMPRQVQPGESALSPLPLNLYFLLTAFGRDDDAAQPFGHELLGKAMSVLYDHPLLSADDIRNATQTALSRNDLAQQPERIRITFHPLTIDELSKLWTGFAMQYRLSAGYEVAVTLIESTRPTRTPLPVLARGPKDSGIASQAALTPPVPTLQSITPPNKQTSARLGDIVALTGVHLNGTNISVQFSHPLLSASLKVPPEPGGTATALSVKIPNQPAVWPAGFYTVAVFVQSPGESFERATNKLSLALAPSLTLAPLSAAAGNIVYTATVSPEVRKGQLVSLLHGSDEFHAGDLAAQTNTLTFATSGLNAGDYFFRLRIDGVDSLLVDRSKTPPVFDSTQTVSVT